MIKFALKVVILGAVFYGLTYFDVLEGLEVIPNPDGPLGEYGTYLWIGLIFGVVLDGGARLKIRQGAVR